MKYTTLFPVLVLTSMFLSFSFYWKFGKGHLRVNSTEQKQNKETPLATSQTRLMKTEKQVNEIFKRIDQLVPKLTFTHMDNTTSARTSKATVLNPKDKYCIGDLLIVRLDMYDYLGNRKKCGGDFLRARIYSPELQAAFSGRIEDLNNGSYLVHFTLSWEGRIRFSFLLFHPSEGVSALWRARNEGYNNVEFTGTFTNATYTATTQCNFNLRTDQEVCEYLETRDEDYFYCVKPLDLPCGSLTSLQSHNTDHSYLSALEKSLIARSNIGIEIPRPFPYIDVFLCGNSTISAMEKCKTEMNPPFPSGFILRNVWNPVFCRKAPLDSPDQIIACLKGKMMYFMGDSTLRQWILYFPKIDKSLKYFDLHRTGLESKLLAMDMDSNLLIQWKKHGHPYIAHKGYTVKDNVYVSREIDLLDGGKYTVIVISLGQHFRPFPIYMFVKRMLGIRKAIERLFMRSPDTKVIIKSENTREMTIDMERFSDFHGYIQYLVVKEIFHDLNIGVVDAWDISTAYASNNVHPHDDVVRSQVYMFLSYIC
ncbi:NXPE family member 1 isoform X1 [Microcaecilia unicolor]|uniref:NXPE family member 1-like isoform X1 n=1 Tax=Microcaecilia unicolor TaxID=1415580 RepID=A0A6P7ZFW2_9AMPH|nr:NXPE family member 1-like isoform X1 [Microcaecilia unicolor]XP_030076759.1 NXPE family member 1-like isoform X1 [Microcaecilia unicolor]XP_030076760.1 NXPE family member 1-like isoform X1 [Microcaecilia unicolor]XP_030076761.1 NXPE family member 1-like isoform X1 [Microcaecilia unicolor]